MSYQELLHEQEQEREREWAVAISFQNVPTAKRFENCHVRS